MANAYADLATLKGSGVLDITGTAYDTRLLSLLEDMSRWIDHYCGRHFYQLVTTRTFDSGGGTALVVPDLISITTLKTDDNLDRTFETTWASTDYLLYPLNAEPTQPWGRPYTRVVVDIESGSKSQFPAGLRAVEIDGKWGYREVLETSSTQVDGAGINATSTTLVVGDGTQLNVGQTLLIDSEQLYVTAISGNNLTVVRGVNGTTAASHAGQSTIQVVQYPAEVVQACLVQSARLWKRKDGAFASPAGLSGIDPHLRQLLGPYRRLATGVGV